MRCRHPLLVIALMLFGAACAPKRPVLYPNSVLQQVGEIRAEQDVDACLEFGAESGYTGKPALRTAGSTVTSGAIGGATGAAAGAVYGRPGTWAGAGAAGGAASGFLRGLLRWRDPDPLQIGFVNTCLVDQGYRVIGWR